jgi:hypothetical protein
LLALLACVAVAATAAVSLSPAEAADPFCGRTVSGGTPDEQAAVKRILCLMPDTRIERVQILEQPPSAPPDALWLAIGASLPPSLADFMRNRRVEWEVDVAAGAIRDGFVRLGLRHVVAYQLVPTGGQPNPERLYGIALPGWGAPRWQSSPLPPTLGKGTETWAQLAAKLDRLARRWVLQSDLERYNPFGKAPVVTVATPHPDDFVGKGGLEAFLRTLRFGEARYDGVLLQLATGGRVVFEESVVDRGRRHSGCAHQGPFPRLTQACHD